MPSAELATFSRPTPTSGTVSRPRCATSSRATTSTKSARPIFEDTNLFSRSVGEETDIVTKEMFTWEDKARAASEKSQSLTLRPENTAGVVRAYIEHQLDKVGKLQKLYYIGPQFRRERPQKGRYRQFYQIGAEIIGPPSAGSESPARDAEVLDMLATLLDELGLRGWTLQLNSVGCAADRASYNQALREALQPVVATMCVRLPAPRRNQSPARARLQGSRRPAHHREAAQDQRVPRRALPRELRGGSRHARRRRRALHHQRAHGARTRLLHAHHLRVHPRRPGRAERRPRRRTLRRPLRIARRPQGSGHRLRHRRRPPDSRAAGRRRHRRRQARRLHRSAWAQE